MSDSYCDIRGSDSDGMVSYSDKRISYSNGRVYDPDIKVSGSDGRVSYLDKRISYSDERVYDPDIKVSGSDGRVSYLDIKTSDPDKRVSHCDKKALDSLEMAGVMVLVIMYKKKHLTEYISWYILKSGGKFMQTARLFVNGRSQAVRLPKEYQFQGEDVYIQKVGDAVILFPVDKEWETFLHGLNNFSDDYLSEGRDQGNNQEREEL